MFAAADLLQTHHIDAPNRTRLLVAALGGLRQVVVQAGVVATPLADLDATTEEAARTSFSARFNLALRLVQDKLPAAKLEDAAIVAMVTGLGDRVTTFFSAERQAEFLSGGYGGIGVFLRLVEGRVYIWAVFSGGPAAQAGIGEFDQVLAVDQRSVRGLTHQDVVDRIRGPEGSAVRLTIRRPGRANPLTVTVRPGRVSAPSVSHRMHPDGIGHIRLHTLGPGAGNAVDLSLKDLQRRGIRALVLDLRQNNFGGLREVDHVASSLLPQGIPLYVVRGRESATGRTSGTPKIPLSVPVVVLVDAGTMWVAEILAAAFSESNRARLVGMRTARQGGYVGSFGIPGGGGLLIKTSRVLTGKGALLEKTVADTSPDEESAAKYSFREYLSEIGYFLLHRQLYEGEEYVMLHHRTGQMFAVPNVPVISPDRARLVTTFPGLSGGYSPNAVQIWFLAPDGLVEEYAIHPRDWEPTGATWVDGSTIRLETRTHAPGGDEIRLQSMELKLRDGKWIIPSVP